MGHFISIAGPSGSGKSTLAELVKSSLLSNKRVVIISIDNYYVDGSKLEMEERAIQNYDHPNAIDFELLNKHLDSARKALSFPRISYCFKTHQRLESNDIIEPSDYYILEGILSLHSPQIRAYSSLKIYVNTRIETCFERRINRDSSDRGRSLDSISTQWNNTVYPMAKQFVYPTRAYADLVIDGELDRRQQLELIFIELRKRHMI